MAESADPRRAKLGPGEGTMRRVLESIFCRRLMDACRYGWNDPSSSSPSSSSSFSFSSIDLDPQLESTVASDCESSENVSCISLDSILGCGRTASSFERALDRGRGGGASN